MSGLEGRAAPGWEAVADAFAANFEEQRELGAACCVYLEGQPVVDLWGGSADGRSGRPWLEDTLVTAFSTTKGATAICAHRLVERGELDLDARVADYWPEFAAAGKEGTRVRWLLSHRAGLPAVDATLTIEDVCAWEPAVRALEAQTPYWPPGERHLYHAQTYGFLVGELVRRVTGKTLGRFFADEVAGPLGLDAWIGAPEEVEPRVAHLVIETPPADLQAAQRARLEQVGVAAEAVPAVLAMAGELAAEPLVARSVDLGGSLPDGLVTENGAYNSRPLRAAELPGSNIVTDARSLARMYAATVGEVDGVRLLAPATVERMCVVQSDESSLYNPPPGFAELAHWFETRFGLGVMRPTRFSPLLGPRSFGHGGAGGSLGCGEPEARVGFGYVMNRMNTNGTDVRAARLVAAVRDCLDG